MAFMFQSLRSSTMPKRLVRFALEKLDFLDSNTLDMDNLDLEIGRNTVLEFRDVGIKLKKLEQALNLPPSFEFVKAKVLLLRINIPVDFYTSPITAEADGVDIRLRVTSLEPEDFESPRSDNPGIVPNTADLAQSFLQNQPEAEKRKLEEAIAAETQDLGASITVSDDGSEDELSFGTGQALSLPAFLADFLQGIVDRIQIRIRNVTIQLDVDVSAEAEQGTRDTVTFQVVSEGIDVEGITTQDTDDSGAPVIVPREGKRHVSLSNIRAYLVSEANVFSAYVRSPSIASPAASHSAARSHHSAFREQSSLSSSLSSARKYGDDYLQDSLEFSPDDYPLRDSEVALNIPYDFEDDDIGEDSPSTPRASVFLDRTTEQHPPLGSQSANIEEETPQWASVNREAQSLGTLGNVGAYELDSSQGLRPRTPERRNSAPDSDTSSQGAEDLARSHVFSHEEAESMYASAFSELPTPPSREMPGAWETYSSPESSPEQGAGRSSISPTASQALAEGRSPGLESPSKPGPKISDDEPDTGEKFALSEGTETKDAEDLRTLEEETDDGPGGSLLLDDSGAEGQERDGNTKPELEGNPELTQPDDAPSTPPPDATPRGPARLVKEIMTLQRFSVYIPSRHKHIHIHPAPLSADNQFKSSTRAPTSPRLPGAFSIYSAHESVASMPEASFQHPHPEPDNIVEVMISPVDIRFDASLGFLLTTVVSKLLDALKRQSPPPSPAPRVAAQKDTEKPPPLPEMKLSVERISLHFLHHLLGVADTPDRMFNPGLFEFDQVTLLRSDVEDLTVSLKPGEPATVTTINVGKFRFGYSDSDIISFDRILKLGASVRDVFPPAGADISVKLTSTDEVTRTEVKTLSVIVQVDLQRLDETFSWFGGLSSFLNMGSSMSSASATAHNAPAPSPKPRGVRFETPIDPNDRTASSENKIDVRTGGLYLQLVGKECDVSLETSAVKMIKRSSGIGLSISAIRLTGPHLKDSRASPPIRVDVKGTDVKYLANPQDEDLERLLNLITPSNARSDFGDDEIMVDTLLRQRRKGPVLRLTIDSVRTNVGQIQQLACLPGLGEEIARLGAVAKYLPEDDRPGLLSLVRVKSMRVSVELERRIGLIGASLGEFQAAHIPLPSLVAIGLESLTVSRNENEELISSVNARTNEDELVLMARMIGDEIEPTFKLRLQGLAFEYRVPTLMDILGLSEDATPQDFDAELAASVANLGEHAHAALVRQHTQSPVLSKSKGKQPAAKPFKVDVVLRDCLLGLNPLGLVSKLTVALTDARLQIVPPNDQDTSAQLELRKAAVLLIDDVSALDVAPPASRARATDNPSQQIAELCAKGYVEICFISSAKATVAIISLEGDNKQVDVSFRDDLLVMETCADSTQTLIALANALKPPTPPSKEIKYRTNVMPVEDLLASISAEAFGNPEGEYDFDNDFAIAQELSGDAGDDEASDTSQLEFHEDYYGEQDVAEMLFDATASSMISVPASQATNLSDAHNFNTKASLEADLDDAHLVVREDWFSSEAPRRAAVHIWNSTKNTYDRAPAELVKKSPLKVTVRDVHVIWNLFDGYDWVRTRDVITKAVEKVEDEARERRSRSDGTNLYEEDLEDEEAVIGDFLFNSIYIGIPANRDARDLRRAINQELNDNATETESVATTAFTTSTVRPGGAQRSGKKKSLKLNRSKRHKITFELQGIDVDLVAFPPGSGETETSIDVRIKNLDIFDHVPTSTWKKFATYDQDAGEREMGSNMVHLEMLNVRPLPELAASEIVLRATLLPLRLHVDQDALDFITRFFEFKDDNVAVHQSPSDIPFLQRVEVNDIPVKLDFKPKRVDYAGLRSGRTTEFMNFVILDEARLVLRHTIIYGISGFERLGDTLNDIWMPDVKKNQLPSVLAGLAPVRSLVNVGSGIKNLIEIPLKEYKKDGRIIRSFSKGASAFVRTTGTELVKLGAKVAVGTQYALQGAEGLLVQRPEAEGGEQDDADSEEPKKISLYADQPMGVIQGLRGGYASLSRDLNVARDAIIAVPGAVMESQNAQGAAKAVLKRAPTIIFRPAIGATKALGQTLLGATNSLDPHNKRRVDEKYKKR